MTSQPTSTAELITEATPIVVTSQAEDTYKDVCKDVQALFDELWELSVQCIYITEAQRTAFILWLLLLRLSGQLRYAPILVIDAQAQGCGKSTLQQFISKMVGYTEVNRYTDFTRAGLKGICEDPYLFLDELDSLPKAQLKSITTLLNTRFESSGAKAINAHGVKSSFGFTCLSGIRLLEKLPIATQSRCIQLQLETVPEDVVLAKTLDEIPAHHLNDINEEIEKILSKHAKQLQYYFEYVEYPQQAVLRSSRFGNVWRNMFDLASLLGEKYVNYLVTCIEMQPQIEGEGLFPDIEYKCTVRDYQAVQTIKIYDGSDVICTDYSTKDFLTGLKAVLEFRQKHSSTGVQTKELFEYINLLTIKDLPPTQRGLGRYMTSLHFKINKNVNKSSGYRFDETLQKINDLYSTSINKELYKQYMQVLMSKPDLN